MADHNQAGLNGTSSDFLKVLLALEAKTMRDLHVASIAKVVDATTEPYTCQLIPTFKDEKEKNIFAYCLEGITLENNDWVLILFTDRNFIRNLKQARLNQNISNIESQSELHSQTYGIIIGKIKHTTSDDPEV